MLPPAGVCGPLREPAAPCCAPWLLNLLPARCDPPRERVCLVLPHGNCLQAQPCATEPEPAQPSPAARSWPCSSCLLPGLSTGSLWGCLTYTIARVDPKAVNGANRPGPASPRGVAGAMLQPAPPAGEDCAGAGALLCLTEPHVSGSVWTGSGSVCQSLRSARRFIIVLGQVCVLGCVTHPPLRRAIRVGLPRCLITGHQLPPPRYSAWLALQRPCCGSLGGT